MGKHYNFIKEAYEGKHGTICQEWKDTILEHYPEFEKEEFKIGDWVVNKQSPKEFIGKIKEIKNDKVYYKGFDYSNAIRKATDKEIESHLIEEAKRRGFKKGVMFKSVKTDVTKNTIHKIGNGPYFEKRHSNGDYVLFDSSGYIFADGQWAEIIKTMTKEEAEKKLNCKIV